MKNNLNCLLSLTLIFSHAEFSVATTKITCPEALSSHNSKTESISKFSDSIAPEHPIFINLRESFVSAWKSVDLKRIFNRKSRSSSEDLPNYKLQFPENPLGEAHFTKDDPLYTTGNEIYRATKQADGSFILKCLEVDCLRGRSYKPLDNFGYATSGGPTMLFWLDLPQLHESFQKLGIGFIDGTNDIYVPPLQTINAKLADLEINLNRKFIRFYEDRAGTSEEYIRRFVENNELPFNETVHDFFLHISAIFEPYENLDLLRKVGKRLLQHFNQSHIAKEFSHLSENQQKILSQIKRQMFNIFVVQIDNATGLNLSQNRSSFYSGAKLVYKLGTIESKNLKAQDIYLDENERRTQKLFLEACRGLGLKPENILSRIDDISYQQLLLIHAVTFGNTFGSNTNLKLELTADLDRAEREFDERMTVAKSISWMIEDRATLFKTPTTINYRPDDTANYGYSYHADDISVADLVRLISNEHQSNNAVEN